jgi:hypothetical protein
MRNEDQIISTFNIRIIGAVSCFLMWIKVFYWMRLFKYTAFLVTLITRTFKGLSIFFMLFFMCIVAFANFFYIINNNTMFNKYNTNYEFKNTEGLEKQDDSFRYVQKYTNVSIIDSII